MRPSGPWRRWLPALIFVVTALCFARALSNGFVWDDWKLIVGTYGFRRLDLRHLRWMFTARYVANFCPLAWLSYGLDYAVWGVDPRGFHLTNILLHAANAVLLFFIARRLLVAADGQDRGRAHDAGAAFAALVFALHPLRVESVAWASERRDVLAGLFFLGSLLQYLRRRLAWSVALFALAAMSKATVVPLPAALLALDFYPLRRLDRKALLEKLPYAAISAGAAAMAIHAQSLYGNLMPLERHGLGARLAQALYGLGFYVSKTALPGHLLVLYPLPKTLSLLSAPAAQGAAALLAAVAALRLLGVRWKAQGGLWGYYVAMLLPVLGLVQNGAQIVALRYSYLSCLGWAVLAGACAAAALGARDLRRGWRAIVPAALACVGLVFGAAVAQDQLMAWHDDASLWSDQVRRYPDSLEGRLNLASGYNAAGRPREAEVEARAALKLEPDNRLGLFILGEALRGQHRLEPAKAAAAELVRRFGSGDDHALLGTILLESGEREAALAQLRRAAELEPGSLWAQYLLGTTLTSAGDPEGLAYLRAAGRLDPGNPLIREALASAGRR